MALLDRLERKYSQKVKLYRLQRQQEYLKRVVQALRGKRLDEGDAPEEADDIMLLMDIR